MEKKTARELFGPNRHLSLHEASINQPMTLHEIELGQLLTRQNIEPSIESNIGTMLSVANDGIASSKELLDTIPNIEIRELVIAIIEERLKKAHERT